MIKPMKDRNRQELLDTIHGSNDEHERQKAKAYLWHTMESLDDAELNQRVRDSSDEIEIRMAKWYLWRRHLDTSLANLLRIISESDDEDQIHEVAIVLGEHDAPQALDALLNLLASGNPYIREGAAIGLRKLKDQRVFAPLIAQIKRAPELAEVLVYALGVLDCASEAEFLVELYVSQPHAPLLRMNLMDCFPPQIIRRIPDHNRKICLGKLDAGIQKAPNDEETEELDRFRSIFMVNTEE